MELNFPEHGGNGFSIDSKEYPNECNDVSIDLIFGDFHIVDIVIDNAHKYRSYRADGMNDIKWEIELSPCEDGSVERKD